MQCAADVRRNWTRSLADIQEEGQGDCLHRWTDLYQPTVGSLLYADRWRATSAFPVMRDEEPALEECKEPLPSIKEAGGETGSEPERSDEPETIEELPVWEESEERSAAPTNSRQRRRQRRRENRERELGTPPYPTRAPVGDEIPFPPVSGRWSRRAWRREHRAQLDDPTRHERTRWWDDNGGAHQTYLWRPSGIPCPGECGRWGTTIDAYEWLGGYCCGCCKARAEGRGAHSAL